jgi:hypothetical protein
MAGPRIGRFTAPQFPFFRREARQAAFDKYNQEQLEKVKRLEQLDEVAELVDEGRLSKEDLAHLKSYAINEFKNPNFDLDEMGSMLMSIGLFILWLGWLFFNGGSAYTLYNSVYNPAKIITNTTLSGAAGGTVVYFVKRPIHLFVSKCNQVRGQYYKTFRSS